MKGLRSARLIQICQEIKINPNRTLKELCKVLNISKQQFYKDKRALEKLKFKFKFSRNKQTFEVLEDAYIPAFNLTLTELLSLGMSVRGIFISGDYTLAKSASDAMKKIISQLPESERRVLYGLFEDLIIREGMGCDPVILEKLSGSVKESKRIVVAYHSYRDNAVKTYTLDPYRLFFKNRALYLDAYSVELKTDRMFRVSRIKKVEFTRFDMKHSRTLRPEAIERHKRAFSVFVGEKSTLVKVRFSQKAAKYIRENPRHHTHRITNLPDGGIIFEVEVAEPREVMWWTLQWGAEAEILEPEWLREEAINLLNKSLENYQKYRNKVNEQV